MTSTIDPDKPYRDALRTEKASTSYPKMAEKYGVNQYYLWHMVREDDFDPPTHVRRKMGWPVRGRRLSLELEITDDGEVSIVG